MQIGSGKGKSQLACEACWPGDRVDNRESELLTLLVQKAGKRGLLRNHSSKKDGGQ